MFQPGVCGAQQPLVERSYCVRRLRVPPGLSYDDAAKDGNRSDGDKGKRNRREEGKERKGEREVNPISGARYVRHSRKVQGDPSGM